MASGYIPLTNGFRFPKPYGLYGSGAVAGSLDRSVPETVTDPDADLGGPKIYESYGSGSPT
jgi:hypothetical protein